MAAGGVRIAVDVADMAAAETLLARMGDADSTDLMTNIGALLESSTRERIEETKTAPDGTAWPANREGTSTLLRTGRHLRDSLAFIASRDQVEVGAAWEFAHVHQFGAIIKPSKSPMLVFRLLGRVVRAAKVTIPARAFVGVSAADERDIVHLATDWLNALGAR